MRFTRIRALLALASVVAAPLALATVPGCSDASDHAATEESNETGLDKADWLEKAAKLLRNGEGIGPDDDVNALLAMPREEIVDTFMRDARFGDMVLAFNMYYLGRSVPELKVDPGFGEPRQYDPMVSALPQALASAQSVMTGGNYFDLYSASPPSFRRTNGFFSPPFRRPVVSDAGADGGEAGAPAPVTARSLSAEAFDRAIAGFAVDKNTGCTLTTQAFQTARGTLSQLGFEQAFSIELNSWLSPNPTYANALDCREGRTADQVRPQVEGIKRGFDAIFEQLEQKLAPPMIKNIADFTRIEVSFEGLPPVTTSFTDGGFWSTLPSSSTNYHRRRAAYVLKTYFCDDLTPVNLAATSAMISDAGDGGAAHGTDVHASDPNCQACHYRLDPMGALFRERGVRGSRFPSAQGMITFDDGKAISGEAFAKYLGQWQNPNGTFRAGYYVIGPDGAPRRDTTWLDSDGDTLESLWSYLPRSEVVKSCLTRRLAEYVLGPKQVYDREWLRQISRRLKNEPRSGEQFKALVKTLVLSNTFSTHDPRGGVCYDQPAGATTERPPCAVAHIVQNQCKDCHSSTAARGHLDFGSWVPLQDGTFSWAHTGEDGVQLSQRESLARILDRITSTDPQKAMPYQRALSEEDGKAFKLWLQDTLHVP